MPYADSEFPVLNLYRPIGAWLRGIWFSHVSMLHKSHSNKRKLTCITKTCMQLDTVCSSPMLVKIEVSYVRVSFFHWNCLLCSTNTLYDNLFYVSFLYWNRLLLYQHIIWQPFNIPCSIDVIGIIIEVTKHLLSWFSVAINEILENVFFFLSALQIRIHSHAKVSSFSPFNTQLKYIRFIFQTTPAVHRAPTKLMWEKCGCEWSLFSVFYFLRCNSYGCKKSLKPIQNLLLLFLEQNYDLDLIIVFPVLTVPPVDTS